MEYVLQAIDLEAESLMFDTLNLRALMIAAVATMLLVASILIGSRNLGNFDAALIAYLFGCIFACFGVVYRYSVWLQRPPTWRYFSRGWRLFFRGRTIAYGWELTKHFVVQFLGQPDDVPRRPPDIKARDDAKDFHQFRIRNYELRILSVCTMTGIAPPKFVIRNS